MQGYSQEGMNNGLFFKMWFLDAGKTKVQVWTAFLLHLKVLSFLLRVQGIRQGERLIETLGGWCSSAQWERLCGVHKAQTLFQHRGRGRDRNVINKDFFPLKQRKITSNFWKNSHVQVAWLCCQGGPSGRCAWVFEEGNILWKNG